MSPKIRITAPETYPTLVFTIYEKSKEIREIIDLLEKKKPGEYLLFYSDTPPKFDEKGENIIEEGTGNLEQLSYDGLDF